MFCNKCGSQNDDGAKFCKTCGASLAVNGENTCGGCGSTLESGVQFCPKCGRPRGSIASNPNKEFEGKRTKKSKEVALLLTFFLGWFGLIYTWKKDYIKFIIGIAVIVLLTIIVNVFDSNPWYWYLLLEVAPFGINVSRPRSFFENY